MYCPEKLGNKTRQSTLRKTLYFSVCNLLPIKIPMSCWLKIKVRGCLVGLSVFFYNQPVCYWLIRVLLHIIFIWLYIKAPTNWLGLRGGFLCCYKISIKNQQRLTVNISLHYASFMKATLLL